MPSRRSYLAGVTTVLAGAAGCTESTGPGGTVTSTGSPSETATDPPADAERTVGGDTVGVTDIVARKAVTY
ncbi:MAG: hypothetical protein ABEH90_04920, partial [Halolamina sp.]